MKSKVVDLVCACIVAVMFGSVALLNLIQPDRPTESEMEKRELARMPEFSIETLADGTFFAGTSTFISDTFIYRDRLVGLSRKIDTLRGVDYSLGGENSFVLLGNNTDTSAPEEENADAADKIAAAFDSLMQKEEEETAPIPDDTTDPPPEQDEIENTTDPETPPIETETDVVVTDDTPEPDPPPIDDPVSYTVNAINLSKTSLKLTVGSGSVIYATADYTSESPVTVNVKWTVSNGSIATIASNPSGGIDVKGVSEGVCTLTCSYGEGEDEIVRTCEITVVSINSTSTSNQTEMHADFLTDGMFIYGDAVYTQAFYSAANSGYYAQTAAYYKTLFGENTRVNVVVAPVSSMVVDNEEVQSKVADQRSILDKMQALMDDSVNFVDAYTEMYDHRDEYLFFKSDHHWTARGAYYAYAAYAKSIGLEPTPLDEFDYSIMNDSYSGSMYSYTYDARVKNFTDIIEAFFPRKKHTMTVTGANGTIYNYDSCIVNTNKTYVTFIAGDNPYTVINVPENPQDFNVLVLKDSFGNAFIPFLCEHYGNIIVVDTRYSTFNIYDQLGDYGLSDIIFVNNIQAANSYSWSKMYLGAVGVNLN